MKLLLVGFIKLWRAVVSPLYGNVCKYYPSCSAYGLEAVRVHGALHGSCLAIWRILRCNPWSTGGYDPVPGTPAAAAWEQEQREPAARADSEPEPDVPDVTASRPGSESPAPGPDPGATPDVRGVN